MGHSLAANWLDEPDVLICVDWDKSCKKSIRNARRMRIPTVLVKNEPSVVLPWHGDPRVDSKFSKVIEVGRPNGNPLIKWPQTWDMKYFEKANRLNRIVAVSANKFSFIPGELYSLRSSVYASTDALDVFGIGWERALFANLLKLARELQIAVAAGKRKLSTACLKNILVRPRNFLGPANDKLSVISDYRASLVIENSAEFMSEKLIDSILAGSIPVYVGPPVAVFGIPDELVISAAPGLSGVLEALQRALDSNYEAWHDLAREWLTRPGVREAWEGARACEVIIKAASTAK